MSLLIGLFCHKLLVQKQLPFLVLYVGYRRYFT